MRTKEQLEADFPAYLSRIGVPAKIIQTLREPLRDNIAIPAARQWFADENKRELVLIGGVGSGKSVAACEMFRGNYRPVQSWDHNGTPFPLDYRWCGGAHVDMKDLSTRSMYDEEAIDIRLRAQKANLVVLDDAGREVGDGSALLEQILNARHDNNLRTIITANLPPAQVAQRFGSRVMDRLKRSDIINCGQESMR